MKKKNIVLTAVFIVLLVAAVVAAIFIINGIKAERLEKEMREKPVKIAFYNTGSKIQESVTHLVKTEWEKLSPGFSYEFVTLSGSKSLEDHLFDDPSICLVFTDATQAESVRDRGVSPDPSVYDIMPTSVRSVSGTSVPLLLDSLEVLYSRKALISTGTETSPLMQDLVDFGKAAAGNRRFTFGVPAQDDNTLGMMVAAFMESLYSDKALETMKTVIAKAEQADDPSDIFEKVLSASGNDCFEKTLKAILEWRNRGLLHTEWYAMSMQEIEYLMETDLLSVVFMPLSVHRNLSYRTAEKYEEMFFPAGRVENQAEKRRLVYTVYTGTVLKNRYAEKSEVCMSVLKELLNGENQTVLSEKTGLAPANAGTETADRQASNARLWAAAADRPVAGLYEAFTEPAARTAFFAGLKEYLKVN